ISSGSLLECAALRPITATDWCGCQSVEGPSQEMAESLPANALPPATDMCEATKFQSQSSTRPSGSRSSIGKSRSEASRYRTPDLVPGHFMPLLGRGLLDKPGSSLTALGFPPLLALG